MASSFIRARVMLTSTEQLSCVLVETDCTAGVSTKSLCHTSSQTFSETVPLIHEASDADDTSRPSAIMGQIHQHPNDEAIPFDEHCGSAERHGNPSSCPLINQLPTELLCEIFTQYLRAESLCLPCRYPRLTSRSSVGSPITLSHVCMRWRCVSLSMATLWSSIQVRRPGVYMIPIIRSWLQRAGDCPLSIRILQSDDVGHIEHSATEEVLSLLIERVHLWKSIDFQFSTGPYHSLLDLSEGAIKVLESALVDLRDWDNASADQLWRVLHASPTLRQADWFGFDELELPSHAPWSQLTHIMISRIMTDGEVMELLKTCPAVTVLDIPFLDRSPTPAESACVMLPNLHTLKFGTSTSDYAAMFDNLALPALECLDIKHSYGYTITGTLPFINGLMERSSCRLQKFTLCDWGMDEEELLSILALPVLHTLSELELMACTTDRTALSLTSPQGGATEYLLPHLKAITIGESRTTDGVVSDMVVSRLPQLEAFQIENAFQGGQLSSKLCCARDSLIIDTLRREGHQFYLSLEHTFTS